MSRKRKHEDEEEVERPHKLLKVEEVEEEKDDFGEDVVFAIKDFPCFDPNLNVWKYFIKYLQDHPETKAFLERLPPEALVTPMLNTFQNVLKSPTHLCAFYGNEDYSWMQTLLQKSETKKGPSPFLESFPCEEEQQKSMKKRWIEVTDNEFNQISREMEDKTGAGGGRGGGGPSFKWISCSISNAHGIVTMKSEFTDDDAKFVEEVLVKQLPDFFKMPLEKKKKTTRRNTNPNKTSFRFIYQDTMANVEIKLGFFRNTKSLQMYATKCCVEGVIQPHIETLLALWSTLQQKPVIIEKYPGFDNLRISLDIHHPLNIIESGATAPLSKEVIESVPVAPLSRGVIESGAVAPLSIPILSLQESHQIIRKQESQSQISGTFKKKRKKTRDMPGMTIYIPTLPDHHQNVQKEDEKLEKEYEEMTDEGKKARGKMCRLFASGKGTLMGVRNIVQLLDILSKLFEHVQPLLSPISSINNNKKMKKKKSKTTKKPQEKYPAKGRHSSMHSISRLLFLKMGLP
jgi:hypothetical protein